MSLLAFTSAGPACASEPVRGPTLGNSLQVEPVSGLYRVESRSSPDTGSTSEELPRVGPRTGSAPPSRRLARRS